jgi:glycosyltransferase involved in cell wall biosynthesis
MKIAQVAPLTESVPPKLYGGTERVIAYLSEELVHQGHEVSLFASGDSKTSATLVPVWPCALRLGGVATCHIAPHLLMLEHVASCAHEFDIVHFHVSEIHFPLVRRLATPHLTTLHGRLDLQELPPLYREFRDVPVVSISNAQRRPIREAGWIGTVHHGLPSNLLRFHPKKGRYLAFLGRISPEKRVDRAIAIAKALGQPLRIAAKVDEADRAYFDREIRQLLDDPLVHFVGEIDEAQKDDFLGQASALLFPIDWPEPFGLVMIEALACGVPVVAFRGGSVGEVIQPGDTGFIVDSLDDAIEAARRVPSLDRGRCRAAFEERFTAARMATAYLRLYEQLVTQGASRPSVVAGAA